MTDTTSDAAPSSSGAESAPGGAAPEPSVAPSATDTARASAWAEFDRTERKQDKTDDRAAPAGTARASQRETATPSRPQPPQPGAGAADIWAAATPQQQAAFRAAKEKADTHDRMRGTVSGLNRKITELERALKERPAKAYPAAAAEFFASGDWREFRDAFPEAAAKQEKLFRRVLGKLDGLDGLPEVRSHINEIAAERRSRALANEYARVVQVHADYDTIARSPAFTAWYESQPPYIKAAVERNGARVIDGAEVAHIVKLFKTETGRGVSASAFSTASPNARRAAQLESASSPRTTGPGAISVATGSDRRGAWDYWEARGL